MKVIVNKENLSPDEFILEYLRVQDRGCFISPTQIGHEYGEYKHGRTHWKTGYHSAWASPRCKKLVSLGGLERNKNGHYRLTNR